METLIHTYTRHDLGAQVGENEVSFRVWAPHAYAVALVGNFNDWQEKEALSLQAEENGHWHLTTDRIKVGEEYQYLVTGPEGDTFYRNDPHARLLTNSAGNAVVYQDTYEWQHQNFRTENWNQLVIYEMHIGTFNVTQEGQPGTFATGIEKLPVLKELGVNMIEVMPINEFAGDYSWGYNPAYPYAVEEAYGGPDGFKTFVDAAHGLGIGVILDVVYNHFGPSDMSLWRFDGWSEGDGGGIYFYNDWRKATPWGDTRPDYGRQEVRRYISENAKLWMDEFRCDGLRMDMVPYIRNVKGSDDDEGSNIAEGFTLLQEINQQLREQYPNALLVAEDMHEKNFITDDVEHGGCGFSSQWDASFVHTVRGAMIVGDDTHRDLYKIRRVLERRYSGDAFKRVIYTDSHDEVANGQARLAHEIGDGTLDDFYTQKRVALAAAFLFTTPGIPMLFQGQTILEDRWFSDQDPVDWKHLDHFNGIHRLYGDLIALRRNLNGKSAGLTRQDVQVLHQDDDNKVLVYLRYGKNPLEDGNLVVLNFADRAHDEYRVGIPFNAELELLFDSDWRGYSEAFDDHPTSGLITCEVEAFNQQPCFVTFTLANYGAYIYQIHPRTS